MSEKLEQVAKAIKTKAWELDLPLRNEECTDLARTAIKEILVPTEAMIRAGNRDEDDFNRAGIDEAKTVEIYQAMVRAALR